VRKKSKQIQKSIGRADCDAVLSDVHANFNNIREEVIGSRLPLDPLVADERFIHRIRQDSDEFNEYLKLINLGG